MAPLLQFSSPQPASIPKLTRSSSPTAQLLRSNTMSTGVVGQRSAKAMTPGMNRVSSNNQIWRGVKLIAAFTCKSVLNLNEKILTMAFLGATVCVLKAGVYLPQRYTFEIFKNLIEFAKFLEFAIEKENFKNQSKDVLRSRLFHLKKVEKNSVKFLSHDTRQI